jgi:hypothetical protein
MSTAPSAHSESKSMSDAVPFTTAVGRLVQGSLYKPSTTDMEGKPLVIKTGPNAGQARVDYYFAVAIPKGTETHWSMTSWGKVIWDVGHRDWPAGQADAPTFAWKIRDGDSTIPNKAGTRPVDQEGFKGCWVVSFSSSYAPKLFTTMGQKTPVPYTEDGAIRPGYFVEVAANVAGNGVALNPGVFINHSMVNLRAYGPEIVFGPDPEDAGFGASPLPAGASLTPLGATTPPPVTTATAPPPGVTPHTAFAFGPAAPPPPPAAAPPPPTASARRMTAKAGGYTYEALVGQGWTDATLVQHGYMEA